MGEPYVLGAIWSYPREDFGLDETGVAVVLPRVGSGQHTANGEIRDPQRLTGAHRTLQLPAIVMVTNLENGREIRIRVNDRGPGKAGRILGLSPRAATLLGIPPDGAARVRLRVDAGPSRALAAAMRDPEDSGLAMTAAPRVAVVTEALAPLPGARDSRRVRAVATRPIQRSGETGALAAELPPDPLPEVVTQGHAMPGRLVVEAGTFFRRDLAQRQAAGLARLAARVEPFGAGRQPQHRVRMGPFADIAAADRAVAAVLAAGLPEARLLID